MYRRSSETMPTAFWREKKRKKLLKQSVCVLFESEIALETLWFDVPNIKVQNIFTYYTQIYRSLAASIFHFHEKKNFYRYVLMCRFLSLLTSCEFHIFWITHAKTKRKKRNKFVTCSHLYWIWVGVGDNVPLHCFNFFIIHTVCYCS